MNKKFLFGTFLLVALIFGISLIGFILLSDDDSTSKDDTNDNGSSVSSPVDTSSPTNTADATDGTEDWIEYVDPDYGFSFKYPKEWELSFEGPIDAHQVILKKDGYGILIVPQEIDQQDGISMDSGELFEEKFLDDTTSLLIDGIEARIYRYSTATIKKSGLRIFFPDKSNKDYFNNYIGFVSYSYIKNKLSISLSFYMDKNNFQEVYWNDIYKILTTFRWSK